MNFNFGVSVTVTVAFVSIVYLICQTSAAPWVTLDDTEGNLTLPRRPWSEVLESRVVPHPKRCDVYYLYNFPMLCAPGFCFDGGVVTCDLCEKVAKKRPECGGLSDGMYLMIIFAVALFLNIFIKLGSIDKNKIYTFR